VHLFFSLDVAGRLERTVVGMRNRATPRVYPTDPQPSPIPPYVPPKRTKYDDLVDVLADGLFEMVLNDDAPVPIPRKRRRGVPASA
jgi:hypothetical protein